MTLRLLSAALLAVTTSLAVRAQVVADPSAPKDQRPTVLRSANGVTQVNVQTPSAAGVSRNAYRQFDVPAQGVILNNSRTDARTELGGWVQGNPWLARGPARILLNEINSADPSRLAGRVEVAGTRAEVVIANPAGITCSGCGFLNASRATLTTGKPVMADGALQAYRVQGGSLEISGTGMDARGTDYAALIARAVQVNANVWANHLAVVAGANEVAAGSPLDAPPAATPVAAAGPAPRVQIDVSALGGLYAGKIFLVGTGAGLGVVQAGRVVAGLELVLRTDGWLTHSGQLDAGGRLHIDAGSVDNAASGSLTGLQTGITVRETFTNRGLVDGATTRIDARTVHNFGTGRLLGDRLAIGADTLTNDSETLEGARADAVIAARERLDIGARELTNRENALIFSAGTAGDALTIGGALDAQGRVTGRAEKVVNSSATIESLGGLRLDAWRLDNTNAHFATHIVQTLDPTQRAYIQPMGGPRLPADLFAWEGWSRAGRYRYRTDPSAGSGAVLGQSPVPRVGEQSCTGEDGQEVCTRLPGADYPAGHPAWAYFGQAAPEPEPVPPAVREPVSPDAARAASCAAGAAQDARACDAYNADLAAYQAAHVAYTQAWGDHAARREAWQADTDARYAQLDGRIEAYNAGFAGTYIQNWTQYQVTRSERETRVMRSDPGRILSGGVLHIAGNELVNDKSQIVAGGALTGDLSNLRTIEAEGVRIVSESGTSQYTASRWRGGSKRYHQRDWAGVASYAPADEVTSLVLPVAQRREQAGPNPMATPQTVAHPAGPASGLFRPAADGAAPYFIETDPRFINWRQWQQAVSAQGGHPTDPAGSHKRLGDAFFEQQMIRDQVLRLTGQRFLAGHASDEAQYLALLQAGATFARAHALRPGVVLTAAQMAQLTTDMVWLVLTDVTLPDGRTVQALVPQLHMAVRKGDLADTGALLAGHSVDLRLSGDLVNAGTIAGRTALVIDAENIRNLGGRLQGETVSAQARTDLESRGGVIRGGSGLDVQAGRDLAVESTTRTQRAQAGLSSGERTHIDRLAGLYVTEPGGTLLARAGRDLQLAGAQVVSLPALPGQAAGSTVIVAGRDLLLGAVEVSSSTRTVADARNFRSDASQSGVGSRIEVQGDLTLAAGRDAKAVAATLASQEGEVTLLAGRDVFLAAGQAREQRDEARQLTQRGTLSKTTTTTRDTLDETVAVGSLLSGRTVSVQAGQDIRVTGSQVVSTDATQMAAGRDVTIEAATQTHTSQSLRDERKSGVLSSGGVGVTLGVRQQTAEQDSAATTVAAATVGSTDGSVAIAAGQAYRQVGSDVQAPRGDIGIDAARIDITEGRESSRTQVRTQSRQSGVTLAVSNPVVSAVQTVRQMARAASRTEDRRMRVLAAANAALAVRSAAKAATDPKGQPELAGGVNVNISLGRSRSESRTLQVTEQAAASSVLAGGSVELRASGAGVESDLTVQGSTVRAAGDLALQADHDIRLRAARNLATEESSSRSDGASLGVGFGVGARGAGLSVTASASAARGNADGQEVTWTSAQVQAGEHLRIASTGDTTLRGAVAQGALVQAEVGGKLVIESLQDTQRYESHQRSVNASLSVGGQTSGSVGGGRSEIASGYASVNETSGLRAGDGGFQVSVQDDAVLEGGVITSSQAAVEAGGNRFAAGSLALRDIENRAHYSASSVSVNLGAAHNAEGRLAPQGTSAGVGQDSAQASSMTRAGVSGMAGHQEARTGDASTGIAPIFDAQRVQGEIDAQTQITQRFGLEAPRAVADYAQARASELRQRARERPPGSERDRLLGEAKAWEEGGAYRVVLHASLGGLGGGMQGALGAGAAAAASPALEGLQIHLAQGLRAAGASEAVAQGAATWVASATAVAIGARAGGQTAAGAAAALNVDANNRQLHPTEIRWIKENARRYALARGITDSEAEKQLADQAFRQVQGGAEGAWDSQASAFLRSAGRQQLPADPAHAQAGPGYLFYATPQQQADARIYLDAVVRSPQALAFYRDNRILQPTVEQILQASGTSQAAREKVKGQTVRAAMAAAALALAPSFSGAVEAVAAFARDPVGYCMVQPAACLVSAELAMTAVADAPVSGVHLPAAGKTAKVLAQEALVAEEIAALRALGARNTTVAAQLDHAVIGRSEAKLYNDLAERAKVRVDTRHDAFYAANTDRSLLERYNMDMHHVLAGEINARGAATGYHAEFAAGGAARIKPHGVVKVNSNGTYEAEVQIWDQSKGLWVDKRRYSTFFPANWSQARIEYETTQAFKAGAPRTGFFGVSPSGIRIQFRWDAKNQRTTFYPLGE